MTATADQSLRDVTVLIRDRRIESVTPAATTKAPSDAAGKRADLLLLDADPLMDIGNTRRIAAVIVGGRHMPRSELDAMLRDLARRNEAAPISSLGN